MRFIGSPFDEGEGRKEELHRMNKLKEITYVIEKLKKCERRGEKEPGMREILYEFDLMGSDLSGLDFSGCNFSGSRFCGVEFRNCDFSDADFEKAKFDCADMRDIWLKDICVNLDDLSIKNGCGQKENRFISAGPLGGEGRFLIWDFVDDRLRSGAFEGSLSEFEAMARQSSGSQRLRFSQYKAALVFFKTIAKNIKRQGN